MKAEDISLRYRRKDKNMEFEKLKKIIATEMSGVSEDQITMETRFVDDLHADSLDVVQIVMAIEETFGIEIPDDAAEQFQTVGQAVEAIKNAK